MITLDQITHVTPGSVTTFSFDHQVTDQNQILVVLVGVANAVVTPTSVAFNGVLLTKSVQSASQAPAAIFVLRNPPVGTYPITVTASGSGFQSAAALSISGVSKKNTNFITASATAATATASLTLNNLMGNNVILDLVSSTTAAGTNPSPIQTQIYNNTNSANMAASITVNKSRSVPLSWGLSVSAGWDYVAIVLPQEPASSISYPNIASRSTLDTIVANNLHTGTTPDNGSFEAGSSTFYRNSFLHTIGRLTGSLEVGNGIGRGNYNKTGIITIDAITQWSGAVTTALTINHSVAHQNSVLLVIAGRTSGALTGAKFNGSSLVPLLSQGLGIFYMKNPPVGTYPLDIISSGTNNVGVTILTLSGVDIKNTNPVLITWGGVANGSFSNLTSIPFLDITPTIPNSLVIDAVTDAANPGQLTMPLNGQTQLYNNNNSQRLGISYSIISGPTTLTWGSTVKTANHTGNYVGVLLTPNNYSSIWYPAINNKTIDGLIRLFNLNDGQSGVNSAISAQYTGGADVFYKNSFLHTVGRILPISTTSNIITDQTITGIARIAKDVSQTILGRARIQISATQDILGRARIALVTSQTIQGLARITATTTQTITGKARITATTLQTILGKARIQITTSQTIQGLARITAQASQIILGKARITATATQTILGKARVTATTTQAILGKASLGTVATQTIQGLARITAQTTRTITGNADILNTTTQTILGKARIQITSTQMILGKARIGIATSQTIQGLARLTQAVSQTITGKARVTISTTQTILGKARMEITTSQTILGKAYIAGSGLVTTTQTILGKARITNSTPQTITGKALIMSTIVPPQPKIIIVDGNLAMRLTRLLYTKL